jgi:hypothetical protein
MYIHLTPFLRKTTTEKMKQLKEMLETKNIHCLAFSFTKRVHEFDLVSHNTYLVALRKPPPFVTIHNHHHVDASDRRTA